MEVLKFANNKEFVLEGIHVIEFHAYEKLQKENERLKEQLSCLCKVPTQPYEKEMAMEIARLTKEIRQIKTQNEKYKKAED